MHSVDGENSTYNHDLPAAPHDHNSCSICYVIGQAVSNLVLTSALEVTEPLFEQSLAHSERAAPAALLLLEALLQAVLAAVEFADASFFAMQMNSRYAA